METQFIAGNSSTEISKNKLTPVIVLDPLFHTPENEYRCLEASCPCHRSFERALIPAEAPRVVMDRKLQARMPAGYTLATLEHRNKTVYIMLVNGVPQLTAHGHLAYSTNPTNIIRWANSRAEDSSWVVTKW